MAEQWKDIEGYEGLYEVSSHGNIRRNGRLLKISVGNGYGHVILCKDGKHKNASPHRLVASAFLPKEDGKDFINHKDANRLNNRVENLEWCTQKENVLHALTMGRKKMIDREQIITEAKREKIFLLKSLGLKLVEIAKTLSVHPSTVSRVINYKRQYSLI